MQEKTLNKETSEQNSNSKKVRLFKAFPGWGTNPVSFGSFYLFSRS
jgi:hypothetical protein